MGGALRGEFVELRAIERANLDAYTRWFRDPEVMENMSLPMVPVTREAEEAWFERVSREPNGHSLAIHLLADGTLIGNCGLHNIAQRDRNADFGIVIGEKDRWGRGYGTDATRVMLEFGFTQLNLHRIALDVFEFNERGLRAYTKAGFRQEGRRRDGLFRHGRYWDVIQMSILEDEWREGQRPVASAEEKKPVRRPRTSGPGRTRRPRKR